MNYHFEAVVYIDEKGAIPSVAEFLEFIRSKDSGITRITITATAESTLW